MKPVYSPAADDRRADGGLGVTMTEQERLIKDTVEVRTRAEELLRSLQAAKAESELHLAQSGQRDHLRALTGKSSLDNAIASTKRMIETLTRHLEQFNHPANGR
jgi:hypothetical protein